MFQTKVLLNTLALELLEATKPVDIINPPITIGQTIDHILWFLSNRPMTIKRESITVVTTTGILGLWAYTMFTWILFLLLHNAQAKAKAKARSPLHFSYK